MLRKQTRAEEKNFTTGLHGVMHGVTRKKSGVYSLLYLIIFVLSAVSCSRSNPVAETHPASVPVPVARPAARAMAILQTGEQPLWFQLTEDGPVHIESIEDAIFSAALVPWPLALHIRFFHEKGDELIMAINCDGFLKLAPYSGDAAGLALYRFSGGGFWRQYTVGGFVFYDDKPAALLYLDDHFLDSDAPLPQPRAWTFNMESNTPFALDIPALRQFPAEEGWDVDTLRPGFDRFWYYRAVKKSGAPEIRMLRTADLSLAGETVSLEAFQNSTPRVTGLSHSSLPPLPEGFVYTGTGRAGDNLFASWEEQEDYNIGAAGFVVVKRE